MKGKLARSPGLFLAGFMGSGKSTVGKILAEEMGWEFVDLDELIVAAEGQPISEIFQALGESAFRQMEHDAVKTQVRAAERGHPRVVALGGGAFVQDSNRELLLSAGTVVWLDVPLERLRERIAAEAHLRPLANDPNLLETLYASRQPGYARADFRVDADADPAVIVERILELPLW